MKVLLPTPLGEFTNGLRELEAKGATVDELLHDLNGRFPGIRFRMVDEQNHIRPHIKIFINAELERSLARPLLDDDEVLVVAALSGG